ncbi:unnamed protein product [Arctia plantaginis]|nr:unnamed protein product [Arctia plantaginis]
MQTKWRVLRDGFTRSVKNYNEKLESGGKGKLYLYYEQLHFLHDLYAAKSINQRSSGSSIRHKKKRHKQNTDDMSDLDDERVAPKRAVIAGTNSSENNDESGIEADKQFLLSLLSDFRKIPEDQKLDAKGDIINVIRHYRSPTVQFDARGSYYTNDIAALATTATDDYYEQAMIDNCSRGSSPIEIKFTT